MFSISVLIPLIGEKEIPETIKSVAEQNYENCEILILRNDIKDLPMGIEVEERKAAIETSKLRIRELLIRRKGKGNALNVGIKYATSDFVCVLDADCVLEKNAFFTAMRHFEDTSVSAVGGNLKAVNEKMNLLVFLQKIEYMKTFNICRAIFNYLDANCLVSGAYGIFRKYDIELVNGYDANTVGEDMEVVLSIQELLREIGRKVVYEKDSVCYTVTPATIYRLLRQRDRWQRGLLDCLIKHGRLILNPKYGLLGCLVIPYQIFVELLSPIFIILYFINFIFAGIGFETYFAVIELVKIVHIKHFWSLYFVYLAYELLLTCHAEYLECGKMYAYIAKIPEAVVAVVFGSLLSIPLALARLWGMISFPWRRMVW